MLVLTILLPILFATGFPVHNVTAGYRIGPVVGNTWPTTGTGTAQVNGVSTGDPTGSGTTEIVTAGQRSNGTTVGELRLYHKSSGTLILDGNQTFSRTLASSFSLNQAVISDVDGDGIPDIVVVGNSQGFQNQSHIGVYHWTGATLVKAKLFNFTAANPAQAISTTGLAIWEKAGVFHIVTAGYMQTGTNAYSAQLGIWQWDGSVFSKKTLYNWTTPGGYAQAQSVAVGDVNLSGTPDIVTVGYSNNGTITNTQMRLWSWDGSSLNAVQTREWLGATIVSSVAIKDATGAGGAPEIIVSNSATEYPYIKGELTIWSDSTGLLTQLARTEFLSSSQANFEAITGLGVAKVDSSGKIEIVTAGFTSIPLGSTNVPYTVIRAWTWDGMTLSLVEASVDATPVSAIPYSMTVADVDNPADGIQDIVLGGAAVISNVNRGMVQVRDVAYVYGTLALTASPSSSLAGQSVTVGGTLLNQTNGAALASTQVILESSQAGGTYQLIATVTTDSQGRYATSFTPSSTGSYTVRATWNGAEGYMSAQTTTSLTVSKASSVIVLYASSLNLKPGDSVTVKGYIYPATVANVTLTYTDPSGATTTHTITSDNTGAFSDQTTVNGAGSWRVSASWNGNGQTLSASSDAVRIESTPDPLALTLATYGFILAVGALALGAIAIVRITKKKDSGLSSRAP